mmetsp:Transcript_7984/g.19823  ORF Transcript_7984/g.19823 Transcript_7984/m.19823 type:complete len:221 (+) Transcript_7984:368-1030(+)
MCGRGGCRQFAEGGGRLRDRRARVRVQGEYSDDPEPGAPCGPATHSACLGHADATRRNRRFRQTFEAAALGPRVHGRSRQRHRVLSKQHDVRSKSSGRGPFRCVASATIAYRPSVIGSCFMQRQRRRVRKLQPTVHGFVGGTFGTVALHERAHTVRFRSEFGALPLLRRARDSVRSGGRRAYRGKRRPRLATRGAPIAQVAQRRERDVETASFLFGARHL